MRKQRRIHKQEYTVYLSLDFDIFRIRMRACTYEFLALVFLQFLKISRSRSRTLKVYANVFG